MKQSELIEKSKGLYYYVNKNKKSGKKPRKKGAKGAPTDQDWKDAAKTAKESATPVDDDDPRYADDENLPKNKKKKGATPVSDNDPRYKDDENLKKKKESVAEGLGELADVAERDHEVQMARAELYKTAKYAIKLHEMLKGVSEAEGLEGWVQSKITKSASMISSVYHHLDYDQKFDEVTEEKKPDKDGDGVPDWADKKKGPDPKPKKKGTKNMPPQLRKHAEKKMKGESYKDTLASKLAQSLEEKQKGVDGKACWDGYKRMGTKKKGGKTVDNCVKIKK